MGLLTWLLIRNECFSYMNEANFYSIKNDQELTFRSDKIYEFIAWKSDEEQKNETIEKIKGIYPEFGGKGMVDFKLSQDSFGSFKAKRAALIEWYDDKSYKQAQKSDVLDSISWQRFQLELGPF